MTASGLSFGTLDAYLEAYKADYRLAVIPISLVAEHLGMSAAGVSAMLRDNRLDAVRIGRSPFVKLDSLLAREQKRAKEVDAVKRYLEGVARAQRDHVFYEPVMEEVGLNWRIPADRNRIGEILGAISEMTDSGRPKCLLTVLVHRKTSGRTRPGPGFFNLAETLGYEWSDDDDFVAKETAKVLKAYRGK